MFLTKVGFKWVSSRVERFVTIQRLRGNRCFGDRARQKKMKKVLNEVSENYHKGIKSQILAFLSDIEARSTAKIVSEVDGARQKVNAELSALVEAGKIEKGISRVSGRFVNWRKPRPSKSSKSDKHKKKDARESSITPF